MPLAAATSPPPQTPPQRSALADLQRRLALGSALLGALLLGAAWRWAPGWGWALLGLGLWGHALVLALEFALAARVNRGDSVAPPSSGQRLAAWWQETQLTPTVFLWRQPFRWRDWPDSVAKPSEAPAEAAVVFFHGFVCNRGFWAPWMRALRGSGLPFTSMNLEPVFGSIDAGIPLIEDTVARAEALCTSPVTLVCHSMGGLAARAWLASAPGNLQRVARVITIGSPHHDTWLARWSRVANGRQMRQHSKWLRELAAKEQALHGDQAYAKFVCWYSNADHIVYPASTATLPGADNRHVPGLAHVALGFHPRVMRESLTMLAPASISLSARTAS